MPSLHLKPGSKLVSRIRSLLGWCWGNVASFQDTWHAAHHQGRCSAVERPPATVGAHGQHPAQLADAWAILAARCAGYDPDAPRREGTLQLIRSAAHLIDLLSLDLGFCRLSHWLHVVTFLKPFSALLFWSAESRCHFRPPPRDHMR